MLPAGAQFVADKKPPGKSTARSRREKENNEFSELARRLPLPSAITAQLDKASIIRLTTSFLHLRNAFPNGFGAWWMERCEQPSSSFPSQTSPPPLLKEFGAHFMQTLEGFVLVLSSTGKIMYISETASVHLGLSQVELIGNSLYDYIFPNDYADLTQVLQWNPEETSVDFMESGLEEFEVERTFFLRMKCVLAKRNAGLTDHGHKVIHCSGYLKLKYCNSLGSAKVGEGCVENLGLVASGNTLPPSAITEIRLSPFTFMFRASMDFKFVFLDSRVSDITGYGLRELLDKSLYDLIHAADLEEICRAHKILLSKHQVTTHYYRLLMKEGGWLWVQSQLALIHVPRASRPSCIVGISHMISDAEYSGLILHELQQSSRSAPETSQQHQTLGAYSEEFYGPNGMLLVQPPNYEAANTQSAAGLSRRSKRPPYQYKDAVTGERRYCLRQTDETSAASCTNSGGGIGRLTGQQQQQQLPSNTTTTLTAAAAAAANTSITTHERTPPLIVNNNSNNNVHNTPTNGTNNNSNSNNNHDEQGIAASSSSTIHVGLEHHTTDTDCQQSMTMNNNNNNNAALQPIHYQVDVPPDLFDEINHQQHEHHLLHRHHPSTMPSHPSTNITHQQQEHSNLHQLLHQHHHQQHPHPHPQHHHHHQHHQQQQQQQFQHHEEGHQQQQQQQQHSLLLDEQNQHVGYSSSLSHLQHQHQHQHQQHHHVNQQQNNIVSGTSGNNDINGDNNNMVELIHRESVIVTSHPNAEHHHHQRQQNHQHQHQQDQQSSLMSSSSSSSSYPSSLL